MDVADTVNELKRLPFSQLKDLPSSSTEIVDNAGRSYQRIVWCEQLAQSKLRILVSLHRIYPLGIDTVLTAEGFTIDAEGNVQMLGPKEIDELMA